MGLRIVVTGGREFADESRLHKLLDQYKDNVDELAHGGARGADTIAGRWAKFYGVPVTVFEADWKAKGKRAGPLRNIKMLDEFKPDIVCAVTGHEGTWHCLLEAQKRSIPIRLG